MAASLPRLVVTAVAVAALLTTVSSCAFTPAAPHALGLHDTHITEGLPMPEYHEAWFGVPLNNSTGRTVTIDSIRLTDAHNLVLGKPFVVDIANGDYIDWYAPPGTSRMQREVERSVPLRGFTIPPHTHGRYEAVVLATARRRDVSASTSGAVIGYESEGHHWEETWQERSRLLVSR